MAKAAKYLSTHHTTVPAASIELDPRIKEKQIIKRRFLYLLLGVFTLAATFMAWGGLPKFGGFVFMLRWKGLAAMLLVGTAIGASAMLFQAVVKNRIITPGILGLDSLYVLIQTTIIFFLGAATLMAVDQTLLFSLSVILMLLFSLLLFKFMFRKEQQNIFYILLLGIVFGTLFSSFNSFMATLLEPGEYLAVQAIGYASFQAVNTKLLGLASVILGITFIFIWRYSKQLDVIALGQDTAVNLGVDHYRLTFKLLVLVVICISVSTALVGPITFLGLLVMNLTLQYLPTYKYRLLIPACILISICVLLLGQIIVQRVFSFNSSISIIINFIGGVYFILLLLKQQRKW